MGIPDTVLVDIFRHFDLLDNHYYRRVSQKWRLILITVLEANHLSVSLTKTQRHTHWFDIGQFASFHASFPISVREWFIAQETMQRNRGILIFGHGEVLLPNVGGRILVKVIKECVSITNHPPKFWLWTSLRLTAEDLIELFIPPIIGLQVGKALPPSCRVLLKNCDLDGINWFRMIPNDLMNSLLSIYVTQVEHINVGCFDTGQYENSKFMYGQAEVAAFSAELLRLGRKYVTPLSSTEHRSLCSIFDYYLLKQSSRPKFSQAVDDIIRRHEPGLAHALIPGALNKLSVGYRRSKIWKLKPLTERLLEALSRDCTYVHLNPPVCYERFMATNHVCFSTSVV